MATKQVNMRLDEKLINNVNPILSSFGLSISDACRIFLNKVVIEDGIPFDLKNNTYHTPNKKTIKAMTTDKVFKANSTKDIWDN